MSRVMTCAIASSAIVVFAIVATSQSAKAEGFVTGPPTQTSKISADQARELAAWARAQAQAGRSSGITPSDLQELEAWASSQPARSPQAPVTNLDSNTMRPVVGESFDATMSNFVELADSAQPIGPPPAAPVRGDIGYQGVASGVGAPAPNEVWGNVWGACYGCCKSGVIGGVEGTFLAPIGEPSQSVTLTNLLNNNVFRGQSNPGLGAGVRAWLGFQHLNGWGYKVRYWHFGNNAMDLNPVVPVSTPAFYENFFLESDIVDVELTQKFCIGCWKVDTSFGGRWARLQRNSSVVGFANLGNVNLYGLATGANAIEGAGFTFSLGGRRRVDWCLPFAVPGCHGAACDVNNPLACCKPKGCWHVFWKMRGSLLWADSTAWALTETTAAIIPPVGAAVANSRNSAFATKDHSENVFIAEAQLGLQYERCLTCLPATFFFRAAAEYQHWETGNVMASANSFAFLQGGGPPAFGGRADAAANAHDGDLDLVGFVLGAGITY